jgi:hypothetical protein
MTDQALLEAAARAAGIFLTPETLAKLFPVWEWDEDFEPYHLEDGGMVGTVAVYSYSGELSGTTSQEWNPLTDDGDALRLAVALRMTVEQYEDQASASTDAGRRLQTSVIGYAVCNGDPLAATRRAIVRAAAAMAPTPATAPAP